MQLTVLIIFTTLTCLAPFAQAQDWSRNAPVPADGRPNPYGVKSLPQTVRAGRLHALNYPVNVTGILLPYAPIKKLLDLEALQRWLGLPEYPAYEGSGPYQIPFLNGTRPADSMGFSKIKTRNGTGFTVSCAQCHSENLFGRRVLGLTNRFPQANELFVLSLKARPLIVPELFQFVTGASDGETNMLRSTLRAMQYVGARKPVQLGLDTSIAQVAISLAKREPDAWAERTAPHLPPSNPWLKLVSDSKPAVWWNVKYKNRWLSDGSVVSGNPIFTNFLWNEIGRGTDLHQLDRWLKQNAGVVRELTTAVFASEPPRYTDFFAATDIDETKARRGEELFNQHCASCHGHYSKGWDEGASDPAARLKTTHVNYHAQTFSVDVGTDPGRYLGMKALTPLNILEISKTNGILIEPQKGYVPPPLLGIWARWPYFHNNSAPSLCAVLTRAADRPTHYWARPALDSRRDFDRVCNGYPQSPVSWNPEYYYDTRRPGLANAGHDEGIFLNQGRELLSWTQKLDLIEYLKVL